MDGTTSKAAGSQEPTHSCATYNIPRCLNVLALFLSLADINDHALSRLRQYEFQGYQITFVAKQLAQQVSSPQALTRHALQQEQQQQTRINGLKIDLIVASGSGKYYNERENICCR